MSDFTDDVDWGEPSEEEDDFYLSFICIKRETKQAWLIQFEMTDDLESVEAWLPKSQCHILTGAQIIQVPAWLVYEKDLEQYDVKQ